MPSRVLKLLSLAGFSGDATVAFECLKHVTTNLEETLRHSVTNLVILGYLLYMEQVFGGGMSKDDQVSEIACIHLIFTQLLKLWAEELSQKMLARYPNGAWPLLYAGRLMQVASCTSCEFVKWLCNADQRVPGASVGQVPRMRRLPIGVAQRSQHLPLGHLLVSR